MHPIEIPEFPRLRGRKAIKALCDVINEFEDHRGEELSDKQTDAMIRIVRVLISAIEAEKNMRAVGALKEQIRTKTVFYPPSAVTVRQRAIEHIQSLARKPT